MNRHPFSVDEAQQIACVEDISLVRFRATAEALEQERVEYAAEVQRHDETKAALLEAQRARDDETRKRYATERERDALLALVGQRCDGIECDHAAERDALKAALREMLKVTSDDGLLVETMTAKEMRQRAREALEEVEP